MSQSVCKPLVLCAVLTALLLVGPLPVAQSQIQYSGDVTGTDPDGTPTGLTYDWYTSYVQNPNTWHYNESEPYSATLNVAVFGFYGQPGTMSLTAGQSLTTTGAYVGYGYDGLSYGYPGGTNYGAGGGSGTINVSGSGATWNCAFQPSWGGGAWYGNLTCGNDSTTSGTVAISAGGRVIAGSLALGRSGTGTLTVDGAGSSMTTYGDAYIGQNATGTATITNGGALNIGGLGYVGAGSGATGRLVVGTGSTLTQTVPPSTYYYPFFVGGGGGGGTLTVNSGATATVGDLYVADNGGSGTGTVNITGANSTLTATSPSGYFKVGGAGQTGLVNITKGGTLNISWGDNYLGNGGNGTVNVDGAGSQWNMYSSGPANQFLQIGNASGGGTLNISGGGRVYVAGTPTGGVPGVFLNNSNALLSIDVGKGSLLTAQNFRGYGVAGKARVVAAADVANGTYTPFSISNWGGAGSDPTFQGVGGKWDSGTHQFTVTSPVSGTAGTPVSITPSGTNQRVLISNGITSATGIGFLSTESALTVTASSLTGGPLSSLNSLLNGTGTAVLDGWMYSTTGGYIAGDPAYLSLSLDSAYSGYSRDDLSVWSYNGSAWSPFAADDLTFDGSYASFTATALNGWDYAIVGTPIVSPHPGDANGDGTVNITDLSAVLTNYDKTGMSWSQGDFNGDGTVNISDLSNVLTDYDKTFSASGIHAVPEPGTLALLAAGLVGLLAFAWRKR